MAPDLSLRAVDARELMDDPGADLRMLERTYRRFTLVNATLSGWRGLYRRRIRPLVRGRDIRILDIGSGGGDIARALAAWSAGDAARTQVVAADADDRATEWASEQDGPSNVSYVTATSRELRDAGEQFDFVVSNHLLHHLSERELMAVLEDSTGLLRPAGLALHSDIARSAAAYALFGAVTWPFTRNLLRDSFIRDDGLTSIRRSYTAQELDAATPAEWRATSAIPYRVILTHQADRG